MGTWIIIKSNQTIESGIKALDANDITDDAQSISTKYAPYSSQAISVLLTSDNDNGSLQI